MQVKSTCQSFGTSWLYTVGWILLLVTAKVKYDLCTYLRKIEYRSLTNGTPLRVFLLDGGHDAVGRSMTFLMWNPSSSFSMTF